MLAAFAVAQQAAGDKNAAQSAPQQKQPVAQKPVMSAAQETELRQAIAKANAAWRDGASREELAPEFSAAMLNGKLSADEFLKRMSAGGGALQFDADVLTLEPAADGWSAIVYESSGPKKASTKQAQQTLVLSRQLWKSVDGEWKIASYELVSTENAKQDEAFRSAKLGVEKAETQWATARVKIDNTAFEKALAPDFYVQLPGRRLTREQFMERISQYPPGVKLKSFRNEILTFEKVGDAWVGYILEKIEYARDKGDGTPALSYALWVTRDGWRYVGGEWTALFSEAVGVQQWTNSDRPTLTTW
jgi:hypothetical protein